MQKNVLEYLENTVAAFPEKIAFSDGTNGLSFREVYDRARASGSFLCRYKSCLIIVFMRKSPEIITAFFGVTYSGNVYIPIDSDMHPDRISRILSRLTPAAAVCDSKSAGQLRDMGFSGDIYLYDEIRRSAVDTAALSRIRAGQIDTDPLYIVFTSGSTGVPKGVVASHRSVINYIDNLVEILDISAETVFGNQVPLYLDACLKEVYSTLKCGAATYLIPKSMFMFPVRLINYLNEHKVNTICWVSSALSIISGLGALESVKPAYLRTIAFGSEIFPLKQFRIWQKALPDTRFFNLYGPTEATGMSCYYEVDRHCLFGETIPIGRPFPNADVFLVADGQRIVEPDKRGVIYIRGAGISAGYYDDEAKTSGVFVQNPLNNHYREIVYNTGDVGMYNARGELVYLYRNDFQIKRHGYRIELTEIEAVANAVEGVAIVCCVYSSVFDNIALYYCGLQNEKELKASLKALMPHYMQPHLIIRLKEMPRSDFHKIDRSELLIKTEELLNGRTAENIDRYASGC